MKFLFDRRRAVHRLAQALQAEHDSLQAWEGVFRNDCGAAERQLSAICTEPLLLQPLLVDAELSHRGDEEEEGDLSDNELPEPTAHVESLAEATTPADRDGHVRPTGAGLLLVYWLEVTCASIRDGPAQDLMHARLREAFGRHRPPPPAAESSCSSLFELVILPAVAEVQHLKVPGRLQSRICQAVVSAFVAVHPSQARSDRLLTRTAQFLAGDGLDLDTIRAVNKTLGLTRSTRQWDAAGSSSSEEVEFREALLARAAVNLLFSRREKPNKLAQFIRSHGLDAHVDSAAMLRELLAQDTRAALTFVSGNIGSRAAAASYQQLMVRLVAERDPHEAATLCCRFGLAEDPEFKALVCGHTAWRVPPPPEGLCDRPLMGGVARRRWRVHR